MIPPTPKTHRQPLARRGPAVGLAALLALPALAALAAALGNALLPAASLSPGEAYHAAGLPLLAAFGGSALAGYAGLLAVRACSAPDAPFRAFSSPTPRGPELALGGRVAPDGYPPPVLPVLTSYFVLQSGLGGRIEALR